MSLNKILRYIFTKLSRLARLVYPEVDDLLYKHKTDDNLVVEPEYFAPIIPMVLVNGTSGIGTGWSTFIPNHDIRAIVKNVRNLIDEKEPEKMVPKFKEYRGKIEAIDKARSVAFGEVSTLDDDVLEITELPPQVWTEAYKETD